MFWRRKWNKPTKAATMTLAREVASRQLGDAVDSPDALIIDNPYNYELSRFAVAENGVITWVGNTTEFCSLIRAAARSATQVAEAA
jgi:hypothetical protein